MVRIFAIRLEVNPLAFNCEWRKGMKRLIPMLIALLLLGTNISAQPRSTSDAKTPSITERVAGMQKFPGFFPFYWDAKAGKVWLEIDKWNSEFLYVESLPAGIGSNDIGLDR